jgi:hypothetical protein
VKRVIIVGPYDVLDVRMQAADTVVFLDFSPLALRMARYPALR